MILDVGELVLWVYDDRKELGVVIKSEDSGCEIHFCDGYKRFYHKAEVVELKANLINYIKNR